MAAPAVVHGRKGCSGLPSARCNACPQRLMLPSAARPAVCQYVCCGSAGALCVRGWAHAGWLWAVRGCCRYKAWKAGMG